MNHICNDMRSERRKKKCVIEFRFQILSISLQKHTHTYASSKRLNHFRSGSDSGGIGSVNYLNFVVYSFFFFNSFAAKKKSANWFEFLRRQRDKIWISIPISLGELMFLSSWIMRLGPIFGGIFLDISSSNVGICFFRTNGVLFRAEKGFVYVHELLNIANHHIMLISKATCELIVISCSIIIMKARRVSQKCTDMNRFTLFIWLIPDETWLTATEPIDEKRKPLSIIFTFTCRGVVRNKRKRHCLLCTHKNVIKFTYVSVFSHFDAALRHSHRVS